jgi:hypothetical protein
LAHCSPTAYLPFFNTNDEERNKRLVDKIKAAIKVMTGGNGGTHAGGSGAMQMAGREFVSSLPLVQLYLSRLIYSVAGQV